MSYPPTFTPDEQEALRKVAIGAMDFGDLPDETNGKVQEIFMVPGPYGQMPYGTAKARTGDPYEWCSNKLNELFEKNQLNDFLGIEDGRTTS